MMLYLCLYFEFFKTGLFAVGGGMATIPFLYDLSDKTGWFTHTDLANMIAVGESTPGPIGVNIATYVGFLTGMSHDGVVGAIAGAVTATLGLITPSVIIILIIAMVLRRFMKYAGIKAFLGGVRPCVIGLILATAATMLMSHLGGFADLNALREVMPGAVYEILPLSPAFITQGGPGCFAVQYIHE